ncbi:MAG: Na+/H+ antiporter NhaA [Bdellovibrionales bacterium]|nr:Na+/H+ antiporter NhaA [Bdellovibrionales bacterium]
MIDQKSDDIHKRRVPKKLPEKVVTKIVSPMNRFLQKDASSGILLMVATAVAMIWANSPFFHSYDHMLHMNVGFTIGGYDVVKTLHHWVNDGLMVIFFFVVGLEIKRELMVGELSTPKKAALPMFAALGGMIIPAIIYTAFNIGGPGQNGWGIPMATDIAFAVGILTLMSKRCPLALKIFLLALAIVDDLGAVLVIALFYTEEIVRNALIAATLGIFVTLFLQFAGVRKVGIYWILGAIVWFAVLKSGVHATVAGVILGLMTPVAPLFDIKRIPEKFKSLVDSISDGITNADKSYKKLDHHTLHHMEELQAVVTESRSPLDRLIHMLHPWVSFFIMPVFALFNAGVRIQDGFDFGAFVSEPIAIGVILGLLIGKPVGVVAFSFLATKLKLAELPAGVGWIHMLAAGFLAGIGFTMALFVGNLALKNPDLEMYSKLGILVASTLAALAGVAMFSMLKPVSEASEQKQAA